MACGREIDDGQPPERQDCADSGICSLVHTAPESLVIRPAMRQPLRHADDRITNWRIDLTDGAGEAAHVNRPPRRRGDRTTALRVCPLRWKRDGARARAADPHGPSHSI